ncbi:MAG: 3-hydroxyacyl-CoA dehydrogenase family protein [Anaerolineaceae bacterium]|nr:3-hydroxyacyl-CoA dehydrogenase family protein [Anaerolineaceae bacterium]
MVAFEDIRRMAMIGAGTMGAGMALCYAQAGYEVALYDVRPEQLEWAQGRIKNSQAVFIEEGLIEAGAAREARERIEITPDLAVALKGVQFVLEAAPEKLDLKQALFREIEDLCPADTILATNTSGLSITSIARACRHPERVGGQHWANPAEIVPLVEVIRGEQTSDETAETIYQVTEKLGKVPVMVKKDVPGFASNRLQYAVLREALHLVAEGVVSVEDVDRTLKNGVGFRYPWLGPLETADLGGLDVFHSVGQYLLPALSAMQTTPEFFDRLIEEGKLGIKTGAGFYDYQDADRDQILRKRDLYFIRQLKLRREVQES